MGAGRPATDNFPPRSMSLKSSHLRPASASCAYGMHSSAVGIPIAHQMKQRGYEIRGLGKEIWQDIDAQEYVNQMRDEWDKRR